MGKFVSKDNLSYFWEKMKSLLGGKVDKVSGKGLSTNDYTTEEKNKLSGISAGAEVNVQSDWNATSGDAFIKNKPTIPTVNNGTLTIQKNGTNVATFTANQSGNSTANLIIPTSASDVSALPDTTKYGASLSLTMNTTTYVLTAQLKDQSGNNLGTAQTIDLPLESVVVSGSYDKSTKKVVLTLKDGSTVDFSVADLVSGLVPNTRKVNGKALSSDITLTASDVGALPSTTTIPTVNNGKLTIKRNNTEVGSFTANQSGNTSINIEVPSLDGVVKTTGTQTVGGTKTFSDGIKLGSSTERGTSTGSIDIEGDVLNAPNLNDITQRGIYHCTKGTNVPTFDYTNSQYDLMVFESEENGVSLVTQMAIVGWKWYIRRYNGTWGAWERFGQSITVDSALSSTSTNPVQNKAVYNAINSISAGLTTSDLLSKVYPVGSIYMSVNSTSPASFLGGTWSQLKDRFLLGAGSSYSNGATGGSATHTLTVDQMPSHSHDLIDWVFWSASNGGWTSFRTGTNSSVSRDGLETESVGGGKAHNNMPPYLVVYMWKRTA
jgi:hypothetical protein